MPFLFVLLAFCLPLYGQEAMLKALDAAISSGNTAEAKNILPKIRSFNPDAGTNTNPLVRAVLAGNKEMASALIAAGANPSALSIVEITKGGFSTLNAFAAAIDKDDAAMLALLFKTAPPIPKFSADTYTLGIFTHAPFSAQTNNAPSRENPFSLIHYAVESSAYHCAAYLAGRMPLNQKTVVTPWFDSAAEWIAQTPSLPIDIALSKSDLKMAEILFNKGSPPPTPELIASFIPNKCNNLPLLELIIAKGAKIDAPNKDGHTALGWVSALLNNGVTVNEYYIEEMGELKPPDAKTKANLYAIEKLLRKAGAKDLGKQGSYEFWMGPDLEYGMYY